MPALIILTDANIEDLTKEPKATPIGLVPLTRMTERNKHRRRDFVLNCDSGNQFVVAVRQSTLNPLDFSVILYYKMPGLTTEFRLRRYNGRHVHTNTIEGNVIHDFHIHIATERYQKRNLKEDGFAVVSSRHCDLNSAVRCLIEDCGFRPVSPSSQINLPLAPESP